ncbi:LPXTG-motif protein cell wall anchor domain protein [Aerococcus christensenii]|uniref:LPXTG-motif protein cell wall anchor domain protein n=1 Tax=Aerococcus christensenii TaxID=87541 RepID=A0A133Y2U0_9LACT|nr:LPXTG-motif protein cell wall anchor domain protein [Aerococcus christensenii]
MKRKVENRPSEASHSLGQKQLTTLPETGILERVTSLLVGFLTTVGGSFVLRKKK